MNYRQLGKAGVRVSAIGLGTNQFGTQVDDAAVGEIIAAAQELGVNFIDTADAYGGGRSEESLGKALQGRWDQFVVATKFYGKMGEGTNDRGSSRYHLLNAVEGSLRRLGTDHIDLYQMHRWDDNTPIEETLRTLDDLISSGKVRYIGASNFAGWQLAQSNLLADIHNWEGVATVQNHYHMLERDAEREVIPYCQQHGVGFIPYFPLAGGFLTGKYRRDEEAPAGSRAERSRYVQEYMTEANYDKVERLHDWAAKRDHTMVELAEAWLLAQPAVCSVISGVTKLSQLESNVRAAGWALAPTELEEINTILSASFSPTT